MMLLLEAQVFLSCMKSLLQTVAFCSVVPDGQQRLLFTVTDASIYICICCLSSSCCVWFSESFNNDRWRTRCYYVGMCMHVYAGSCLYFFGVILPTKKIGVVLAFPSWFWLFGYSHGKSFIFLRLWFKEWLRKLLSLSSCAFFTTFQRWIWHRHRKVTSMTGTSALLPTCYSIILWEHDSLQAGLRTSAQWEAWGWHVPWLEDVAW